MIFQPTGEIVLSSKLELTNLFSVEAHTGGPGAELGLGLGVGVVEGLGVELGLEMGEALTDESMELDDKIGWTKAPEWKKVRGWKMLRV
jgi:hypothetical protein